PPRMAWMLNGSGARRAGEPVRQIGVTLDEIAQRPADTTLQSPVVPDNKPPQDLSLSHSAQMLHVPPDPALGKTSTPANRGRSKESKMHDRKPGPVPPGSAVMSEYFETMRQFLKTQERVMTAYLG